MHNDKHRFHKRLNDRIGIDFHKTLFSNDYFKGKPKLIPCCYYFLSEVLKYNGQNKLQRNNGYSQIYSGDIKYLFQAYKGLYAPAIRELVGMGLLLVDYSYCNAEDKTKSWCHSYKVTEHCTRLLLASEKDYLHRLTNDKETKRAIQKSISKRKVLKLKYDDYVLDYIYDFLCHTSFNTYLAESLMDKLKMDNLTKTASTNSLIDFTLKDFKRLEYNNSDSRLWNLYASIKSELRSVSKYKNWERLYTIDLRSAHPTFFSLFILNHYNTNTIPLCCYKGRQPIQIDALKADSDKWVKLFTADKDPRLVIAEETGIEYKKVKQQLNEALNGNGRYKKVLRWIETNFPNLFNYWNSLDKKKTGILISKWFESQITLDESLYRYADTIKDLKLAYEYDGFSVFGNKQDESFHNKCEMIRDEMAEIAKRKFGIDIVIKIEKCKSYDDIILEIDGKETTIKEIQRDTLLNSESYRKITNNIDRLKPLVAKTRRQAQGCNITAINNKYNALKGALDNLTREKERLLQLN